MALSSLNIYFHVMGEESNLSILFIKMKTYDIFAPSFAAVLVHN